MKLEPVKRSKRRRQTALATIRLRPRPTIAGHYHATLAHTSMGLFSKFLLCKRRA